MSNFQSFLKTLIIALIIPHLCLAEPDPKLTAQPEIQKIWNLPVVLDNKNSKISFKVDSTWHLVHVDVQKIEGSAWLEDPNDYSSVRAEVLLPVKSFDSDNGMRDRKMRGVMAAEEFPLVTFNLEKLENLCDPSSITSKQKCSINVLGKLKIRGVEREFSFPAVISRDVEQFVITGKGELDWSDYGVEDPSILVAKVDKKVLISILLKF